MKRGSASRYLTGCNDTRLIGGVGAMPIHPGYLHKRQPHQWNGFCVR
ncbi:MAG: hypothetical protein GTO60_16555 [Gammaproteobacteria bacterium]|nr:hypothetical protein [Gammaproteobacteria bacterium]